MSLRLEAAHAGEDGEQADRRSPAPITTAWRSNPGRLGGIGWRLLVRVLFFSSAITLLLTMAQLYLDYRSGVRAIDERMSEIDSGYRRSLGEGLWRLDKGQLQLQAEGILRLPDIRYVELREATNGAAPLVITAGSRQLDPPMRQEFRIFHGDRGPEQLLGTLLIEASYEQIYRRLFDTAAVILVSQAIKTFAVSFFILLIVQRLITRHLTAIATSVRRFDLPDTHVSLSLRRRPPSPHDELDDLVGAFNEMWTRLQQAYGELQIQVGLLQQLPVSAWTLKPDGTPDFVNQVWLDFSGQTLEFIRSHPEAWMNAIHPEDRETAAKSFWEGVRSGQSFAIESRSLRARDGTYRRHLQQAVVLRDAEGKVLKFVGTTTDIDDQKRAEETLRRAQSDLARVARVATLNAMTASIAHEVNQPLSGILTNANTGLRMLAADPPNLAGAADTLRRAVRDANRASGVIKRLREMFSKKEPIAELVDLNDAARDVVAISVHELQRRGARLQTELADGLPPVSADRVQLQQVILNLLLNAADAMDGIDDRPRSLLVRTELEGDGAVRLEVRDAGRGFDPATVEKLFEAFHTTKANGLGVGLTICRSIIESHKGRLWATLNDGPGATFSICMPCASADNTSQPQSRMGHESGEPPP
jgi:PAS domain S-box-containing protein